MQAVCEMPHNCAPPPFPPPKGRPGERFRGRLAPSAQRVTAMSNKARPEASAPGWEQLIEAVASRGDRAAFARLFGHFAPRIKTFMRRSGLSEADAENLAQETLLRVWRKAALFNPGTSGFEAWIFTIARNLRIDALRRESRGVLQGASDVDNEFLLDEAPLADEALASRQGAERMREAMAALPGDQQRVVELSFYQERAHADIATVLGIPLGTVKSRLRLAMAKLRSMLDETA